MKTSSRIDAILIFIAVILIVGTALAFAQSPTPATSSSPSSSPNAIPVQPDGELPEMVIPITVPPGFPPVKVRTGGTFEGSDGSQTPAPTATTTPPKTAPPITEQRHDKMTGANLDAPNYVAEQQKKAEATSPSPTPTPSPEIKKEPARVPDKVINVKVGENVEAMIKAAAGDRKVSFIGFYTQKGATQVKIWFVPEKAELNMNPTTTVMTEPASVPNKGLLALIIGICAVVFILSVAWVFANR